VSAGTLKVQFISSRDQLADIFTKALGREVFDWLKFNLCLAGTCLDRGGLLNGIS
jgi:hypothetical protein